MPPNPQKHVFWAHMSDVIGRRLQEVRSVNGCSTHTLGYPQYHWVSPGCSVITKKPCFFSFDLVLLTWSGMDLVRLGSVDRQGLKCTCGKGPNLGINCIWSFEVFFMNQVFFCAYNVLLFVSWQYFRLQAYPTCSYTFISLLPPDLMYRDHIPTYS